VNILCGQSGGFVDDKQVVHIVNTVNQEGLDGHTPRAGETKITFYSTPRWISRGCDAVQTGLTCRQCSAAYSRQDIPEGSVTVTAVLN
jgi:hypothetical protein